MNERQNEGSQTENVSDRRSFYVRLSLIASSVLMALMVLPGAGFILAPLLKKPLQKWRTVGKAKDFETGATVLVQFEDPSQEPWAGVTAKTAAWLRKVDASQFIAFSVNCRHLGCPVRWIEDATLFMCPCHGGVYYSDGTVAGGPPPEALARYQVRVRGENVQIRTAAVPLTTTPLTPNL
ncbi:MAG: ubiquinol-cytochrome c reductase iron-sulfur subunit [Planctomycetales bacterium]|nr:ubiquinol-cytochrome c reductase iron-sulfur subunit [Planctomycetales bacterium]